jgi:hypothetical protein
MTLILPRFAIDPPGRSVARLFQIVRLSQSKSSLVSVAKGKIVRWNFAVYVPADLVPQVRRAVESRRALYDLLVQAGPRHVKALKRVRVSASMRKKS